MESLMESLADILEEVDSLGAPLDTSEEVDSLVALLDQSEEAFEADLLVARL